MDSLRILKLITLFIWFLYFPVAWGTLSPNYPPSANFKVVQLRTDCLAADGCFENLNEAATWVFSHSSATTPITLDIGPGTFAYTGTASFCNLNGYATIKGSGRDNTIISLTSALKFQACPSMVFQDITFRRLNGSGSSYETALKWNGGGSSTWVNVLVDGPNIGWWDTGTEHGVHYWFNSVVRANHAVDPGIGYYLFAYYNDSPSETWYYGGDIEANMGGGWLLTRMAAVYATGTVELFGTSVRVNQNGTNMNGSAFNFNFGSFGLVAYGSNANVHAHGSNIKVASASPTDNACVTIAGYGSAKIHTTGSAYVLSCANGSNLRIYDGGAASIESTFIWKAGTTRPNGIQSVNGQDMFVQTNCASTGCTTVGSQTHLLIYNAQCTTSGPWFDVGTNKCVGE